MMMMMMSDGSFVNSTKKTTLFEKICNWLKQLEEVFHVHPPSLPFVGPYNHECAGGGSQFTSGLGLNQRSE
jgi:hypothetical protein